MGLASACVDRGRLIAKRPAGKVVDGTTITSEVEGAWFRCRLTMREDKQRTETGGRVTTRTPTLITVAKDLAGEALVFGPADRIEINSRELGNAVWDVQGEPEPIRTKRRVIGWQVTLRRNVEPGSA